MRGLRGNQGDHQALPKHTAQVSSCLASSDIQGASSSEVGTLVAPDSKTTGQALPRVSSLCVTWMAAPELALSSPWQGPLSQLPVVSWSPFPGLSSLLEIAQRWFFFPTCFIHCLTLKSLFPEILVTADSASLLGPSM